jgi:hypothetical protein
VRVRWQRRGSDLSASTFSSLLSGCLHALALAEAQDRPVYANAVSSEADGLPGWTGPPFARPPISTLAPGLVQIMADLIRAQLGASFGLPSRRERGRALARACVRANGHVGDGRSDLASIDLVTEVASHPSDDSYELSSVPSDAEPETSELTKAGDVAVLDVAEGERLPLPRKADSNETVKPKTSPEGSLPIVPAPPRTTSQTETSPMPSPPEDTADGAQPAPARPACASLPQAPGGPVSRG